MTRSTRPGVARISGLAALLPPFADVARHRRATSPPVGRRAVCPLTGPVWGEGDILLGGRRQRHHHRPRRRRDHRRRQGASASRSASAPTRPTRPPSSARTDLMENKATQRQLRTGHRRDDAAAGGLRRSRRPGQPGHGRSIVDTGPRRPTAVTPRRRSTATPRSSQVRSRSYTSRRTPTGRSRSRTRPARPPAVAAPADRRRRRHAVPRRAAAVLGRTAAGHASGGSDERHPVAGTLASPRRSLTFAAAVDPLATTCSRRHAVRRRRVHDHRDSRTATSRVVTGLTNGVSYTFQVREVNEFGLGASRRPPTR